MQKLGACIALYEMIPKIQSQAAISSIISNIRSSGARVVLVFAVEQDVAKLFDEAVRYLGLSLGLSKYIRRKTQSY